jgi:CRISPR/Cas system CMR-associated protein Cmr5 small subunit
MGESMAFTKKPAGFVPTPRFVAAFREKFVDDATYWLSVEPERSEKTHDHQFAWLHEAWKSLPEHLTEHFPSSEHLRKRALIDAGFYTEQIIDVGTNAAALRVAAYARSEDEFAYVVARGPIVVVRKAKSQSKRAMGAAEFQRSKQAILAIVAGLIGVEPETLERAA